jgi:colanic acid/amylovoran biosynthesis glycosyltransferase
MSHDGQPVIAYLTSAYARASDTFIRGEVVQLRKMGFTVYTFSIRRPPAEEAVNEEIRREQQNTEYLFDRNIGQLIFAGLKQLVRRPGRCFSAARLAWRTSSPGIKPHIWQLAYLVEACLLAERLAAKGVRHLHNHIGENSAAVAMLASVLSGIPFSLTIHGPVEFDRPTLLALDEKIARACFVVAVCDFGKSQLCRWCNIHDWDKINVVHCGVNGEFVRQPPTPVPAAPRLVSIGRIAEQKGHLLLVDAAAALAARNIDFELIIIGDGPLRDGLQQQIDRLGLGSRVRITGWINSEQIRNELINSRGLVLPSFAEGLPVAIMECLALGRPVISTFVGGIPELVQDGVNGWLVPAGNLEELARALREALTMSSHQLAKMGDAGRVSVVERHNATTEAAKLARLISRSASPGD